MKKIDKYISSLHLIEGKTVIVTGANSGLGFEISKVALIKGARVIMCCRNLERANKAKEQLIKETGKDNIVIELFDQGDLKSVYSFADKIMNEYKDFYALVLNAGIFIPKETVDEYNVTNVYRTNFIGPLALLFKLQQFLEKADSEKRIIIQGSLASFFEKYKKPERYIYGNGDKMSQYAISKLCCSNMYVYFKNINQNPNVKYLLCEPGIAATNLFRNYPKWFKNLATFFIRIFTNTAKEGSLSACKLMCDLAANGDYYRPRSLFSSKGLPKKAFYPQKYVFPAIIDDAIKIIKMYEEQ